MRCRSIRLIVVSHPNTHHKIDCLLSTSGLALSEIAHACVFSNPIVDLCISSATITATTSGLKAPLTALHPPSSQQCSSTPNRLTAHFLAVTLGSGVVWQAISVDELERFLLVLAASHRAIRSGNNRTVRDLCVPDSFLSLCNGGYARMKSLTYWHLRVGKTLVARGEESRAKNACVCA